MTVSSRRLAGFSLSTPASLESRNLGGVFSAPLYFDMNHSYEIKEDNHNRAKWAKGETLSGWLWLVLFSKPVVLSFPDVKTL